MNKVHVHDIVGAQRKPGDGCFKKEHLSSIRRTGTGRVILCKESLTVENLYYNRCHGDSESVNFRMKFRIRSFFDANSN